MTTETNAFCEKCGEEFKFRERFVSVSLQVEYYEPTKPGCIPETGVSHAEDLACYHLRCLPPHLNLEMPTNLGDGDIVSLN